jgi:hypothetical protein
MLHLAFVVLVFDCIKKHDNLFKSYHFYKQRGGNRKQFVMPMGGIPDRDQGW